MATSEPIGRPRTEAQRSAHLDEGFGRTVVYQNEVPRHSVHTRLVHWGVAIFFVAALLSGFAIFTPWLFAWISPLFGGGARARLLHPWFGIGFVILMTFQLRGWLNDMRWQPSDNQWLKRIRAYVTHEDETEPDYVGKFNAGQKVWFWTMVASGVIFLITGIPLWFPEYLGRTLMWICYFFHDVAGLVMLGGFLVHIYEGTAALPGTFRSMVRGTVTRAWAWTHHPGWYKQVTGRDPKADLEQAKRAQAENRGGRS
jgi:formate dehydrogenase subunit gamma